MHALNLFITLSVFFLTIKIYPVHGQTLSNYSVLPLDKPDRPSSGAVFTYLGSLTASNGFHILTFELPLKRIFNNVEAHINRLVTFENTIFFQGMTPFIKETTINTRMSLQRSLASLYSLVSDIRYDVSPKEGHHIIGKRGLINAVGATAEYLFGVATQSDVYSLTSSLNYVNATTNNILNQINIHTTILNKLSPDIEALQATMNNLGKTAYEIADRVGAEQETLALTYEMLNADRLLTKLNSLRIGLHLMHSGEFSYEIIPRELFLQAMEVLEAKGVRLLFNPDVRASVYPHLAKIITLPNLDNSNVRFAIVIPTKRVSDSLDLFQLQTNYVYNTTMKVAFRYKFNYDYVGVTSNSHSVALLNSLKKCRKYAGTIYCPLGFQLYNSERSFCEIDLFFRRSPQTACDVEVTHLTNSVFTPSKSGFFFSTSEETLITVTCSKGKRPIPLHINGNGELKLKSGCVLRYAGIIFYALVNLDETVFDNHTDWILIPQEDEKESFDFHQVIDALERINATGLDDLNLGSGISYTVMSHGLSLPTAVCQNFVPDPESEGYFGIVIGVIVLILLGCVAMRGILCLTCTLRYMRINNVNQMCNEAIIYTSF